MDLWVWLVLVAVIVLLAVGLFAWFRSRQRSGSVRETGKRGDKT